MTKENFTIQVTGLEAKGQVGEIEKPKHKFEVRKAREHPCRNWLHAGLELFVNRVKWYPRMGLIGFYRGSKILSR